MCEYENQTDSIIRDQIVACCSSTKLRRKLLETPNISLQETLKTARSLEAAEMHAKAIEKNETSENNNNNSENSFDDSRLFAKTGSRATNAERNRTGSSAPENRNSSKLGNRRHL